MGSGQLSRWLCREPVTYIGFDVSLRMLAICARKIRHWQRDCLLVQADGERRWPIASGCARLVFASRSIHLLTPDHVIDEVLRLMSRKGGVFVIGRVKRARSSIHECAKFELKRYLRAAGWSAFDGEANQSSLIERLVQHGATRLESLVAGSWSTTTTPGQVIAGWERRPGLAGLDLTRVAQGRAHGGAPELGGGDIRRPRHHAHGLRVLSTQRRTPAACKYRSSLIMSDSSLSEFGQSSEETTC